MPRSPLFVSIVMPALDEERHIAAAIASVRPASLDFDFEILVVDGGSRDATRAIVAELARDDPRIRLIQNPAKVQSAAVNIASREADSRATILVRADCHSEYPLNFVELCLAALQAHSCSSVVVPMLTVGKGCVQKAVAAAQNSRLGNGGASHRLAGSSGYVEHGHHAAFDRAAFLSVGGYSEDMKANEDAELDSRLRAAGHRIWLCGEATIKYLPRENANALARQYFAYGWGRATTCLRSGEWPRLRQIAPAVAFCGVLVSMLLASVDPRFATVAAAYSGLCCFWGALIAVRDRSLCTVLSGPMAITMHMSWGAGFLLRLARHLVEARAPRAKGISST